MKTRLVYFSVILLTVAVYVARLSIAPLEVAPAALFDDTPTPRATHAPVPTWTPTSTPRAEIPVPSPSAATATAVPTATPVPTEPRIFIASERTNTLQVYQGEPPRFVTAIPVGVFPHNISVSNSARWVAVANRHNATVSIIDAQALTETARIHVGNQPHDLSWAPDDKFIYVTQEADYFISVIDTSLWRGVDLIRLDSPTHDLSISPDGSQNWATTIKYRGLVIIDRLKREVIDRLAYFPHGSHDVTFRPDVNEVWVTSSGFIRSDADLDPYVVIFDYSTRQIKNLVPLGIYPFHSVKVYRDGLFLPPNTDTLWYSDRGQNGVILVSVPERRVLATIPTGLGPFHLSFGPNGLLYVINHDSATLSVVDPDSRELLHTVGVAPDPHGLVVIAVPQELP
jgi:YVTN family beta-propeller protein